MLYSGLSSLEEAGFLCFPVERWTRVRLGEAPRRTWVCELMRGSRGMDMDLVGNVRTREPAHEGRLTLKQPENELDPQQSFDSLVKSFLADLAGLDLI